MGSSSSSLMIGDHRPMEGVRESPVDRFRVPNESTPLPTVIPPLGLDQVPRGAEVIFLASDDEPVILCSVCMAGLADEARLP